MTHQTSAPLTHISLHAFNGQARALVAMVDDGHLLVDPPYQRPSTWTRVQQMNLVHSWLTGIPVPAIVVNDRCTSAWAANEGANPLDTGVHLWAVVDGRQRVEATLAWFTGNLPVPASWFAAEDVVETVETDDGPYVTFDQLTVVAQRVTANRAMLPRVESKLGSLAEEADLYLLLNTGGTAQTQADLDNAAQHASR